MKATSYLVGEKNISNSKTIFAFQTMNMIAFGKIFLYQISILNKKRRG